MNALIRYRYNTMHAESPNGEWYWRVIIENADGQYQEILAKSLIVEVPSFSREDLMPVVGRKWHMACFGAFHLESNGIGVIEMV
jgi:hypothetical protein